MPSAASTQRLTPAPEPFVSVSTRTVFAAWRSAIFTQPSSVNGFANVRPKPTFGAVRTPLAPTATEPSFRRAAPVTSGMALLFGTWLRALSDWALVVPDATKSHFISNSPSPTDPLSIGQ